MTDQAIRELSSVLSQAAGPLSAEELYEACRGLGRDLVYATLWSNPLHFVQQHNHRWTLPSRCSRPAGRHAEPETPAAERSEGATVLLEWNGLSLRVTAGPLDSVSPFLVGHFGSVIELSLNVDHALFRGRSLPFQGDVATAALELLLISWALEEATALGDRTRREMADIRYLVGRRIQDLSRVL